MTSGVFLDWSHMTGEEAGHFHEWGMSWLFLPADGPHRDVKEYAKPSPEALLIIQPSTTACRPPFCSLSPVPSTRKRHWVIELFADGAIPTIFNLKATRHKSKQTFWLPAWLMQFNILM